MTMLNGHGQARVIIQTHEYNNVYTVCCIQTFKVIANFISKESNDFFFLYPNFNTSIAAVPYVDHIDI